MKAPHHPITKEAIPIPLGRKIGLEPVVDPVSPPKTVRTNPALVDMPTSTRLRGLTGAPGPAGTTFGTSHGAIGLE